MKKKREKGRKGEKGEKGEKEQKKERRKDNVGEAAGHRCHCPWLAQG